MDDGWAGELWLARHGETDWSRAGRHTGRTDLPLTAKGEASARALSDRLAEPRFDLVLTSPMERARRTAELAGFPDAQVEPLAHEWDYGDLEGLTTAEIRDQVPDWTIWTGPVPGGETAMQVGARADAVLARVREAALPNTLLFAHGHFLRVLAARWLTQAPVEGAHYRLDTGTVSRLGWEREAPVLSRWNA